MTPRRWMFLLAPLTMSLACAAPQRPAAGGASRSPSDSTPSTTPAFRECWRQAHGSWLAERIVREDHQEQRREEVLASIVGPSPEDQARARRQQRDLAAGKYASPEQMGGAVFAACMAASAERADADQAAGCFQEQRLIMYLMVARFDRKASLEEAEARLVAANRSEDGRVEAAIRRLARDTYLRLRDGEGSAFVEAEFLVCTHAAAAPVP